MMNDELTSLIFLIIGNLITFFNNTELNVIRRCLNKDNIILVFTSENKIGECNGLYLISKLIQKDYCYFNSCYLLYLIFAT